MKKRSLLLCMVVFVFISFAFSHAMFIKGGDLHKVHGQVPTFHLKSFKDFTQSGRFEATKKKRKINRFEVYFKKPPLTKEQKRALGRFSSTVPHFEVRFDTITGLPVFIKGKPLYSAGKFASQYGEGEEKLKRIVFSALKAYGELLRISDPERSFKVSKLITDSLGNYHLRLRQIYKGINYFGKEIVVHLDQKSNLYLIEGHYGILPEDFPAIPRISSKEACHRIKKVFSFNGSCASDELVFYDDDYGVPHLSWKFNVCGVRGCWRFFVDALTGEVFKKYKLLYDVAVSGSGRDEQTGNLHSFSVWQEEGVYYFIDTDTAIHKSDPNVTSKDFGQGNLALLYLPYGIIEGGVDWLTSYDPHSWPEAAVSVWYGLKKTLEYYWRTHHRCGMDDTCKSAVGVIGLTDANAFYASELNDFMFFGLGDGYTFAPLTALDVIAHEFTHGVTNYSARLEYQFQSGALNEAFSDIFAVMVDRDDWTIGEDVVRIPPYNLRNLEDPHRSLRPQPATMDEYQPLSIEEDNGGVHINSTIPAHAAYLLASAIGKDKAERIFYQMLTVHLTPQSNFEDFCRAMAQAAEELYGVAEMQAAANICNQIGISVPAGGEPLPEEGPTIPALSGKDYLLFLFYRLENGDLVAYVGEVIPGNSNIYYLSERAAFETRPAPFYYNGQIWALFVDRNHNLVAANVESEYYEEQIWNDSGEIWSVATSPSADLVVYTSIYDNDNNIYFYHPTTNRTESIPINFKGPDAEHFHQTLFPDVVSLSADGRAVFFDCLNRVKFGSTEYEVWLMGRLDLVHKTTSLLLPVPPEGYNIGNPAAGRTHPHLLAYDIFTERRVDTRILDLSTGRSGLVLEGYREMGRGTSGWPYFSGDDSAVYLQYLAEGAMGEMIVKVPVERVGEVWRGVQEQAAVIVEDTEGIGVVMPVAYRKGAVEVFSEVTVSPTSLDFGFVSLGSSKKMSVLVGNAGNYFLEFAGAKVEGGDGAFTVNAVHTTINPGERYKLEVIFSPLEQKIYNATLNIYTSDPRHSVASVVLRGIGILQEAPNGSQARPLPSGPEVTFVQDPTSAPVRIVNGSLKIELYYEGNVDLLVGVATEDFETIYWLEPSTCILKEDIGYVLNTNGISCGEVSIPLGRGYIFWVASVTTNEPFGELLHEGRYEIAFYPFGGP